MEPTKEQPEASTKSKQHQSPHSPSVTQHQKKGFLSTFKPSKELLKQIEADMRGVHIDKMPNIVL